MGMRWVRFGNLLGLPHAPGHDACLDRLATSFVEGVDGLKSLDVVPQLITDVRATLSA